MTAASDGIWFLAYSGSSLVPPNLGRIAYADGAITSFPSGMPNGSAPTAMAIGQDGRVWASVDRGIYWIGPNGTVHDTLPTTLTGATVDSETPRTATVHAALNPNGVSTRYHVEWGTVAGVYPNHGPDLPPAGWSDSTAHLAIATLTGLTPSPVLGTPNIYHWRIVATNADGTVATPDETAQSRVEIIPIIVVGPPPAPCNGINCPIVIGVGGTTGGGDGVTVTSFGWDWNSDGKVDTTCSGAMPVAFHTFAASGSHVVTVTATNDAGGVATTTVTTGGVVKGPPPAGTNPGAGGCGVYNPGGVPCQRTVDWVLVHAVIVGEGCWVDRTPVIDRVGGSVTCIPCVSGPGHRRATLPPDQVPLSQSLVDLLKALSTRILSVQAATPGGSVTVQMNGMLISAHAPPGITPPYLPVIALDGFSGAMYSPNADTAIAPATGDANFAAPVLLARNVNLAVRLPYAQGSPILAGAVPLRSHALFAGGVSGIDNPCDDPAVQALPTIPDIANAAGGGALPNASSAIDGFPLAGPITIHIIDQHLIFCVDLSLPSFSPCLGAGGFSVQATLYSGDSGLVLQNLRAHLGCAVIADIMFQDIGFEYDAPNRHWAASGIVDAIPLPGLAEIKGSIAFDHGTLSSVAIGVVTSLYFGPLIFNGGNVTVTRSPSGGYDTTGSLSIGTIPKIPVLNVEPLSMDATYGFFPTAAVPNITLGGVADFFGAPLGTTTLTDYYQLGVLHASAETSFGLKDVLEARGNLSVWVWGPDLSQPYGSQGNVLKFDAYGSATVTVLGAIEVGGDGRISSRGAAACLDVLGLDHIGAKVYWSPFAISEMWDTCDVATGIIVGGTKPGPAHAAGGGATSYTIAPGTRLGVIGASGATASPTFTLTSPTGKVYAAGPDGYVKGADYQVLHSVRTHTTFLVVAHPTPGRWTLRPAPGSPAITSVRYAPNLPEPHVRAHVTGSGDARHLAYAITPAHGQTVQFYEQVRGILTPLGKPVGARRGAIAFRPAYAPSGARQVVAVVLQDGIERRRLTVATYTTKRVALHAPTHVKLRRVKHRSLVITWRRTAHTLTTLWIRLSDGRELYLTTAKQTLTIPRFTDYLSARVRIVATATPRASAALSFRVRAARKR
jgi:PKD repeat protein